MTPVGSSLAFCSSACVEEFRRRGTCFNCLRRPVADPEAFVCAECRATYRAAKAEADRVSQELWAIHRAERLPAAYRRTGPSLWAGDSTEE